MDCVLKETLRFLPPVNMVGRRATEDIHIEVDGKIRTIFKGTDFIVDIDLIHRSPNYWKDPDSFKPERKFFESRSMLFSSFFIGPS